LLKERSMSRGSWVGLACAAATAAVAASALAGPPPVYAIRNARLVPVSGPPIARGTIVVARGVIAAVGADAAVPPEALVIDGAGLTVYPGLFDAMTDLGLAAPPQRGAPSGQPGGGAPASPAAPPRPPARGPDDRPASTPWVIAADEISTTDRRIETWRTAGFTTVLTAPRTGIFPGQGSVINLAGDRPGDMVVAASATFQINLQPPGGFASFPGSLMGVVAYVRQVFLDRAHYRQAMEAYRRDPRGLERPRYDRTVETLDAALVGGRPVVVPAATATQIRRVIGLAGELGFKGILFGAHEGYEVAQAISAAGLPVIVSAKWPEQPREADPEAVPPLRVLRLRDRAPSTPAALHAAGVRFALASDGLPAAADFLRNVRRAVEAGLPAEAAVRALTLSPAEMLGLADRLGSLDVGKIANLVVTTGDLFDEKTRVRYVFVDGQKFDVREAGRDRPATEGVTR
jgi:imidazolonepropionase-like amidohydrolase